ncbi:MAG: mycofactocin-associated electron transfer flavoprotein alpha subunit [Streptosporangiaceae bacterium]
MRAVVPVRGGSLPLGGEEAVAEADGRALLAGDGTDAAAAALACAFTEALCWEAPPYAPGAWARAIAPAVRDEDILLLPASPDGRDLAPRLAAELERPLLAGALSVDTRRVVLVRRGGRITEEVSVTGPAVATLQPGVRGVEPRASDAPAGTRKAVVLDAGGGHDAEVLEVLPPDPETMDLAEAGRIVAGGAGLRSQESFGLLARVAPALGASMGATRVVADAGWVPFERQIGTTGVTVDPELYIALGVSGAVQHVSGIGTPAHVIAVNTDPSAPMMALADLALVTDAPELLRELARRLGVADAS